MVEEGDSGLDEEDVRSSSGNSISSYVCCRRLYDFVDVIPVFVSSSLVDKDGFPSIKVVTCFCESTNCCDGLGEITANGI